MQNETPEDLRRVVAANVRARARALTGGAHVRAMAFATGWRTGRLYAVLGARVSLCIDQLASLAIGLRTTPAALVRPDGRSDARC